MECTSCAMLWSTYNPEQWNADTMSYCYSVAFPFRYLIGTCNQTKQLIVSHFTFDRCDFVSSSYKNDMTEISWIPVWEIYLLIIHQWKYSFKLHVSRYHRSTKYVMGLPVLNL